MMPGDDLLQPNGENRSKDKFPNHFRWILANLELRRWRAFTQRDGVESFLDSPKHGFPWCVVFYLHFRGFYAHLSRVK